LFKEASCVLPETETPKSVFVAAFISKILFCHSSYFAFRIGDSDNCGLLAFSADETTEEVVPDPDATSSKSPSRIAGVLVSPTMNTV
jgi:hypothetical protein